MGRMLVGLIHRHPDADVRAAIEVPGHPNLGQDAGELAGVGPIGAPLVDAYEDIVGEDTVMLDFTLPAGAVEHLRVAVAKKAPIVIGTTGFNSAEQEQLNGLATKTRSVVAPNMSVGVNVLLGLVAAAARALGSSFDAEIVEMHHRRKVDAPSGTALALGNVLATALGRDLAADARYGREGVVGPRTDREIGIMSLRGGDVVGDHTVVFAGMSERLELTHRAQSREAFARGALRAALWIPSQPPGRYSMADVLGLS